MKTFDVINKGNIPTISWKKLKEEFEPNDLKEKKNRNVGDLKTSILRLGFAVPLFLWIEGKYVIDGAGRMKALELLEYEGYTIPDLPYIPISAKSKKEAKQLTLAISSKYGITTNDSVGAFISDMEEIDLSFVSLDGFDLEELVWTPPMTKEIDVASMKGKTKMEHTCPKCSFSWSAGE